MMIGWQSGRWLGSFGLNVTVHLVVDSITASCLLRFGGSGSIVSVLVSELLLNLQVGINCVHAEVEIRAVLLVILWANMRLLLLSWGEDVGRSTALNGQNKIETLNEKCEKP